MQKPAVLALQDGTLFRGRSIGAPGSSVGEVVFNTAMTGYQEILTDPSYCRQIVTLTYPHIGNTGANLQDMEASIIHGAGLVIRELPPRYSSWRSGTSLSEFLIENGVVAIANIDTRKLTRVLREKGAQAGCLMAGDIDDDKAIHAAQMFPGLEGMDLAQEVTTNRNYDWDHGEWQLEGNEFQTTGRQKFRVVAYDFGVKRNILRMLAQRGCQVSVVSANTSAEEVLARKPDGVFLSNGPGDPEPCGYAIEAIQQILDSGVPVFGICLGHQLMALASGAKTHKMKFGHHGANHPVQDLDSGQVYITSQNHGFAVDEATLPSNIRITHRSLFDQTVQGIERTDRVAFSFQGHPEASPGPHDIGSLFDRFTKAMSDNV